MKNKEGLYVNINEDVDKERFTVVSWKKKKIDGIDRFVTDNLPEIGVFPIDFNPESGKKYNVVIERMENKSRGRNFYHLKVVGSEDVSVSSDKDIEVKNIKDLNDGVDKKDNSGDVKRENRLDKILNSIAKQAVEFTASKDDSIKNLWEKSEAGNKQSLNDFKKKIQGLWRDFAVHGIIAFDRNKNKVVLKPRTDIDGRASIGLLKMAGFNVDNIKYINPGESAIGFYNIDTGFNKGFVSRKSNKDKVVTLWRDHHGADVEKKTLPATRLVYLEMVALGLLKKDKTLDDLTRFVSRIDRASYPNQENLFWKSDKTIFGLYEGVKFEDLYNYFKSGRSPEEELSDKDIEKYNLKELSAKKALIIKNTKKVNEELKKDGFIVNSKFGKILVDVDKKFQGGYLGALACGYDGYLLFNQLTESFILSVKPISMKEEKDKTRFSDLSKINIPGSIIVKKNMVMRPISETPINVSLGDIIDKINGNVIEGSKLKRVINGLRVRLRETETMPKLSMDKNGNEKWISRDFNKLAIFPKKFNPDKDKKYKVRVKYDSNPGERNGVYYLEVLGGIADDEKKDNFSVKPELKEGGGEFEADKIINEPELEKKGNEFEAEKITDKIISDNIEEKINNIREEILGLQKEVEFYYSKNRYGETIAVLKKIKELEKEIVKIKEGGFMDRDISNIYNEAYNANREFLFSKKGIRELGVFRKPKNMAEWYGHIITGGVIYGFISLYRYFRYRKARKVAKLDYKSNLFNLKKNNRDLFIKLVQKVTGNNDLSLSYGILNRMILDEGDKDKKRVLKIIKNGLNGFITQRLVRDKDSLLPDSLMFVKEIKEKNRYPKLSFSKLSVLVNAAKTMGLYS